ncbi:SMP-30/gluconolactonase/LRE family protein [Gilvimarinus sp. SDUM040013]|uniref:SMP-30/gluconolactonase/LRE family protein n=1 Tax=Gilvimarinus gilvus TaxID=3058038 RepID=A0ABU4RVE5_9GAMM|nr:SMP-30/gluconolactonase/LRE family protein [Gilvimarinus sp. SDUM040013]MDO3387732.1 SMP-30/gluconolactonase/LRE family protein [Gilvimarinus sp. SDUM040013]MDX6848827.1 SMP-30/gluconolactonase/LRE family protein [Gilvimarinus sp. SDUM040013]
MQLVAEIPCGCELGEAILWHPVQRRMWWADILGCRLYSANLFGDAQQWYPTPEPVTAFGFTSVAGKFIVSFASGIAYFWPATGAVEWLAQPDLGGAERFNDGRVGPDGAFWAGTMSPSAPGESQLYRFDGSLQSILQGLTIANGLCWSTDGGYLHHADSPSRLIRRFKMRAAGVEAGELLVETPVNSYPDGAVIDAADNLWSAHWGGSCVVAYDHSGAVLDRLALPITQPTCVAFGGDQFDHLLVTSAWEHMTPEQRQREPRAGNVFVFRTTYRGRPCDFYTS